MNRNKFNVILRAENRKVYNYLLKILRNREDAEDILQETFVVFYRKMDVINEQAYKSYLYRTAHNKALNLIKSRKKHDSSTHENLDYIMEPAREPDNQKKNEMIRNAISQLPKKYALLLEMQFYQNMSYKEIAQALETTASAIDSRLVRAKKKLKKILLPEINNRK